MYQVVHNAVCCVIAAVPALFIMFLFPSRAGVVIGLLVGAIALAFANKSLRGL